MTIYKTTIRPLLFLLPPDAAHLLASFGLRIIGSIRPVKKMIGKILNHDHEILAAEVSGLRFRNPVGLAAGFDPNGTQSPCYDAMGFGFATIGSVTCRGQVGNPRPHFTRLNKDHSLIVNKGLKNQGAEKVSRRIGNFRKRGLIGYPLGISIARTSTTPEKETAGDYAKSFRLLAPQADYVELNVSCPNVTQFPAEKQLKYVKEILSEINHIRRSDRTYQVPVWLKLGPDASDEWNRRLVEICLQENVDAIVLTNLVKDRSKLQIQSENSASSAGGISGKLLEKLSEEKLTFFYKHLKGRIPLISVGGIFTAEDVYRRINKGASLVQMITGWIYEGPTSIKNINKNLVRLLEKDGYKYIQEALGKKNCS